MAVVIGIQVEDDETGLAREHDEVGVQAVVLAEDAAVVLAACRAGHVGQSPGRPVPFHYTAIVSGGTEPAGGAGSLLISSFSSLPGLKYGTFFGGTSTLSPVFGLRPLRGSRFRSRKLPNPRSSIFSPRCSASMMLRNTVSTITSECFFVRSDTRETSSTSSALVMLPFVIAESLSVMGVGDWGLARPTNHTLPITQSLIPSPQSPVPEVIAERRRAVARALLVGFPVGAEFVALERANRETDLPLRRRELDDLHRVGLAHRQRDLLVLARMVGVVELRNVNQSLDALVELDERAKVRHPDDLALDRVADVVAREEVVPDVGGELLQAERQPLVLGVDVQHHRLDDVALLQHFRWMLDPLAPRHVGDVDQAVDLLFDFDERAELGEVANLALDLRADRVLVGEVVPRVALDLLEAERNPPRRRIDAEHHGVHRVADIEDLRRVLDALAPRHLADVDQPLDAGLELDERAVVGEAHHLAAHARADRIPIHHVRPRVGDQLLVAERDALGRRIVLEHDHVDFVVHLEQL